LEHKKVRFLRPRTASSLGKKILKDFLCIIALAKGRVASTKDITIFEETKKN
jgi:hypothetical protein